MPKVTVLMPTYNVAPYVKEAVDSVLGQKYADFELLVIDDCSTDNTVEVVRGISDPRIRIVRNDSNMGLANNLNRGLSLIHTEYVARMDGDDIAEPHWLGEELSVLECHPEIGVCGGCGKRFGTSDSLVMLPEGHEDCVVGMLFQCSILVLVFRHELFSKYGLKYDPDAFPAEDYRFWADCCKVIRLHNVQQVLFHYRMHETQICTSLKEIQVEKANEVRRIMLEWIGRELSEEEVDFFLHSFVTMEVHDKHALDECWKFMERLCRLNAANGRFDQAALRRGLSDHIRIGLYSSIIEDFFGEGYRMKSYGNYLRSGLAFHTKPKLEAKLLLKSIFG